MALDIDKLGAEPACEVSSSQGPLYVYPPGQISVGRFNEFADLSPDKKGSKLFDMLVSQVRRERHSEGDPQPLPSTVREALTERDRQLVVDALQAVLQKRRATGKDALLLRPLDQRKDNESAYTYLASIVDAEFEEQALQMRATMDNALRGLGGTVGDAFKQLNATTRRLGGTLADFDRLDRPLKRSIEVNTSMAEMQARIAREHQEDRERARLTSQMTAESAKMLKQLVEAAEQFMVRIARRDYDDAASVRKQIRLALISLFLGVFLSAAALWYAKASYDHDLAKDGLDDVTAKAAAEREERISRALEQNAALQQQNVQLLEQLRAMAARQATSERPTSSAKH